MPELNIKKLLVTGALNNIAFAAAGGALAILQTVLVIRLLGPREMGEFAVAAAFAATLEFLSDFGVGDRLVQQKEIRLHDAYRQALTVQLLVAIPLWAAVFFSAPAIGRFYALPGLSLLIKFMSFQAFGGVCRLPLFVIYRDLKYFQHRLLIFTGKVAAFLITVLLAFNGYGAWSMAIGTFVGLAASCIPAWYIAALSPGWRFRSSEARSLFSFGWPVWLSRVTLISVEQGTVLVVSFLLSVQELGQYKSTEQLSHIAIMVEVVFAQTLYPVLCRVKDSRSQLSSMISKSGRSAMVVVAGAGFGVLVFAEQIVNILLGPRWKGAELFLAAHGIGLLLGALAFNWEAVFRSLGDTKPILRVSVIYATSFFAILCPLTYAFGKIGTAIGIVVVNLIGFTARNYYFNRLGLVTSMFEIIWRAYLAALAATAGLLLLRTFAGPASQPGAWILELTLYTSVYIVILLRLERKLIGGVMQLLVYRAPMRIDNTASHT